MPRRNRTTTMKEYSEGKDDLRNHFLSHFGFYDRDVTHGPSAIETIWTINGLNLND